MAGTISFSGLSASGLDTSSWVDALVSVKQQTVTSLEAEKAEKENLLSIVNNIKSYFSSFQSCLQKITDSQYGIASMDLFLQNLALSSNTNIATASATTEAARQSYDVAVDSLATATKATSGYSQVEVKTADLNTTFGTLGGKNGTITVNSQSFNVTTEDTLQDLIDKFKNVGVDASFDEKKGTFTIGIDLDKIDEGATNLKNALKLANNNVSGAVSGSVVYASRSTEFSKLGLKGGDINIEGVKHTITKNGDSYTITKDGGTAVSMDTLGDFLDYLMSSAVGAEDASVDGKGHIVIKGATLDKVEGGTNLMEVLNLVESQKRTVSESGALSYIEVRVADLNTKLEQLGITADTTLVAGGKENTIGKDKTLGDIQKILKNAGVDMSVDNRGIITIDTHGNEISGTLLDVLNLDPTKGGTTITSSAHQATLNATGNTKLSDLGVDDSMKYTAYKSDGTALTAEISNLSGKTVNDLVNALKNAGLDAKFDEKTHQISIKDGYIEGSLADALGMTQITSNYTENANLNTLLSALGATGDSTLTIDGGAAKTYGKDTTLKTVFDDIEAAGGKVTFKDGNVTIEGVTLGGSIPTLLGLEATTQGTSVTSGKLTAVTGSESTGGSTDATVEHNIDLSTKIGDITGNNSNYTLKVGDGDSKTYGKDNTLQDLKTQVEAAGGKFTINDDNTISIDGVTMSGTLVGVLGFDEVATGTRFSTVEAIMISGTSNVASGGTTLGNLGLVKDTPATHSLARRAAAQSGGMTLSINGGASKTYGADTSLDDIFADIIAAGGTASIDSDGYVVIDGVHLDGSLVDALGLVETSYKTTITSGDLKVTTSTKSTSSSTLYTEEKGDISWSSTIGSITGDNNSYDMTINGTNKTFGTDTRLSDIKSAIQNAGGTMTINDDNSISINGVEISGSLVNKLGFVSDGVHTVVSSNNPIYYTDGKKSADTGTTFEQLGIASNKRDYTIRKNDGTVVKASSTDGTAGSKSIGDWLKIINDSLNTANGTSGITYAKITDGVISISGGYVTGSLPTALGIGTKETVTGITMEGSSVTYIEYDPLKYIGNTQNGSGLAAGSVTNTGFLADALEYRDDSGNIHNVTLDTKLSEVLDASGNKLGSGSFTFNVGGYTHTFDGDSTTLSDVINYVNNLNSDTTHDTTTSASFADGKISIESNVNITGTLLDKLGFTKQEISSVAYEVKGDKITVTSPTSMSSIRSLQVSYTEVQTTYTGATVKTAAKGYSTDTKLVDIDSTYKNQKITIDKVTGGSTSSRDDLLIYGSGDSNNSNTSSGGLNDFNKETTIIGGGSSTGITRTELKSMTIDSSTTIQDVLDFYHNSGYASAVYDQTTGDISISYKNGATLGTNPFTVDSGSGKVNIGQTGGSTATTSTTLGDLASALMLAQTIKLVNNGSEYSYDVSSATTIQQVLDFLNNTAGCKATFSAGKLTVKGGSDLEFKKSNGTLGSDSFYYYNMSTLFGGTMTKASSTSPLTGNKYTGDTVSTVAKSYSTDTRLVNISRDYLGSQMYVYTQNSSGTIGSGVIGTDGSYENQGGSASISYTIVDTLNIDAYTTIQDVIDFYKPYLKSSDLLNQGYTYSDDGVLSLTFQSGYTASPMGMLANKITFGTTTPTTATASTKLRDLGVSNSGVKSIKLVNNGTEYSFDVSDVGTNYVTIQDVLDFLNDEVGCTATFEDGKLTVWGADDLEFKTPSNKTIGGVSVIDTTYDMSALFGGNMTKSSYSDTGSGITKLMTKSTTIGQIFGDTSSHTISLEDGTDITLASTDTMATLISKLAEKGLVCEIENGQLILATAGKHILTGDIVERLFGQHSVSIFGGGGDTSVAKLSTKVKTLIGKDGDQTLTLTPTAGGSEKVLTFKGTDTIQTIIDKLKAEGIDEAEFTNGVFRIKDDKQWTISGKLANRLFGKDFVYSYTGDKVTYTTTISGGAGSVTGNQLTYTTPTISRTGKDLKSYSSTKVADETYITKTYTGTEVTYGGTTAGAYSANTQISTIASKLVGHSITIYSEAKANEDQEAYGVGSTGSSNINGSASKDDLEMKEVNFGQVATMKIGQFTSISDIVSWLNSQTSYINSASYDSSTGKISVSLKDGIDVGTPFEENRTGGSGCYGGTKACQVPLRESSPSTTATTSTTLKTLFTGGESGLMANIQTQLKVVNNGNTYTTDLKPGSTIQDVLNFLNNTAGCTATFTDGQLSVTGREDFTIEEVSSLTGGSLDTYLPLLFGGSIPTARTGTKTKYGMITWTESVATGSSTLGSLFKMNMDLLGYSYAINGTDLSGISSSSTIDQVLAAMSSAFADYGLTGSISGGKVTLSSTKDITLSGDIINSFFGSSSITLSASDSGCTVTNTSHTSNGSTTMSQLGITDFTVNGSALSGITSSSTVNQVLSALKSQYNLSDANINDGKITLYSDTAQTLSGNLIKALMGQNSVTITPTGPATKTGNKVTYTKSTTQEQYKYSGVTFNRSGGSDRLGDYKIMKTTGSTDMTYTTSQGMQVQDGWTISFDGKNVSSRFTIERTTTMFELYQACASCGIAIVDLGDGLWGLQSAGSGGATSVNLGNLAYGTNWHDGVQYLGIIGRVVKETTSTSTTNQTLTADTSTTMSDLGLSPSLTVDGTAVTGLSSSSTVSQVLSALKNQFGIDGTISDGQMTLTATGTHTLTGDVINKFFGSNSITLTPTSSGGSTTITHTADTSTTLGELGIENDGSAWLKISGYSLGSLSYGSTIADVFELLANSSDITATMNDGVISLTSDTDVTLSGAVVKRLFGQSSITLADNKVYKFEMEQTSGTKYLYTSRTLTHNAGPERVSEVSELVAGNKYHIASADDLVALANFVKNGADTTGSIFIFDNDIDMSGVTGFEGIGILANAFKGTVYGNGHVVKNMTIDTTRNYIGLFGYLENATIQDIGVIDANVKAGTYTGILIGEARNSKIINAYTTGTVNSTGGQIGGLAGELRDSTVSNIYSTATVTGKLNVGGLIGDSSGTVIERAYATGNVTATDKQVGGLIGAMEKGGSVKNSYATGDVNGNKYVGGFVGLIESASISYTLDTVYSTGRVSGTSTVGGFVGVRNTGATANITNAVYNRNTTATAVGYGSTTGVSGRDYQQMIQKSVMQNLGFTEDKGWVYAGNYTPTLGNTTVTGGGKTYLDSSITSFASGSSYYISTVEQLNNLATLVNNGADTTGVNFILENDIDASSFSNSIGGDIFDNGANAFKGTFYGNGHSIIGLSTNLFYTVDGDAVIRDLALENMVSGKLAQNVKGNSIVDNVYSTGQAAMAGLIGTLSGNATLKNSYSTAHVFSNTMAGGLVTTMDGNATIEHSFASGSAETRGSLAGGLVAQATGGTIKSSYATGRVYTSSGTSGGLIGSVRGTLTVTNSYASGNVSGRMVGGFIGNNSGTVTSTGNVYNRANSSAVGIGSSISGLTALSLSDMRSQAKMKELGFTSANGWYYYEGKTPMLQGKDTSSAGTTKQMKGSTTLDSLCKNGENKKLTVTINGTTHSKTFDASDDVDAVKEWLNSIDGVNATLSNGKFTVSGDSADFKIQGEIANILFGDSKTTTKTTITENTDSKKLITDGDQKKINKNTTVGQLLGVTSGKYAITYTDDKGNLQSETFTYDQKLSDVLDYLNSKGFTADIVDGVFTATKNGNRATDIGGTIGSKLKGEDGTVTISNSGYRTGELASSSSSKATASTKLSELGIASGSIFIKDNNNNTLGTIQINSSMTIDDAAQLLANYGFTLSISDGKVTVESDGINRLADGTSNMVSQMKLDNWTETKDKLKLDSTVAQMGFGKGSTLSLIIDNKTYNLTFDANATLQDIIDTLGTYGVTASVDAKGKFTASAKGNLVLSNELGAYLTRNSAEGYVKEADGYKSKDPLDFKGDKVKLDYDSKVGDILGTGKDGVLRLTLNKDTVIDLTYKADETMADIIADLKGYGITATIEDGVLKAISTDKTFKFSGEIGKIISGDTPLYEDISTGYVSKDLSYTTTNKATLNNTLKEIGVSSGQIHILSNDGKIVSTLDVDESYTIAQVKSLLQPFGMTLSVDDEGKFSIASKEGYKLSDGTSNMVSKMGLNNWTTSTEKLSGSTTLAEMGFKDGADLNLFLDGAVMNVLSFDANQTLDDIIFGLAAYGIDASVNADGQFTATSKSHTFVMSGGLGSYLTKGTGGYVNSDTAYQSYKPLVEELPYTESASEGLKYKQLMTESSTLESLGFAQGGTVRVMLDGTTPYTLSFLATDKVQDVIYALSAYGINAEIKDGKFVAESVNNTFTLSGNFGSYLVQGGAYQNEVTGYESKAWTYKTTEKLTNDTKLSDLGVTRGDINVIKDGKVTDTIHITEDTTLGQLFSAIKPYGMTGSIFTDKDGNTAVRISADSNIKLADGTSNVVSALGLHDVRKGDFEGTKKYWDDDATSGLITEDTLLSTLDRNGFIAQGSLMFRTGTGDDAVDHIINISANETVGSLLKKFNDSGIKAVLDDGVIKLTGGLDKLEFTGGTSGLVETIGLDIHNIDKYASSTSALTYEGETHYSASNFANADTKLDIVNATDGNMSIFVDGVKCTIEVKSSETFGDLFEKIKNTVKARTGLDMKVGFKTKDGSISANPTDANNTGIIGFEIEEGHELVIGASNDTTNFATIANLNKTDYNAVTGSRALYRVNVNSLITESGLYRDGDITEGTFKIGDAEFTIDSTTTLASLINQINKNDKAYASAYWDTLAGTLVIESTVTGASLISIEAGTSNFTDIMGFTKTKDGVSALVTDSQTLGQNAVVRINGTTVTSATNVISSDISKIKGLTINLKNVSAGETVTITVEQDKESIYNAVSDTLDAYNTMMEALNKELSDRNSLGGESILKLMRNNLKRLMTSSLTGAYVFKNLASVGISTGEASDNISTSVTSLLIDKDKFMDALSTDSDAVQDLLVGTKANPGIFLQANNIVENSISSEGYFTNMANTLTKSINSIQKKITRTNSAIENYRTKLESKFHNMELTISGLQSAYANILK